MTTQPTQDLMHPSVVCFYNERYPSRSIQRPTLPTNVLSSYGCIPPFGCLLVHQQLSNIPMRIRWRSFTVLCYCPLLLHSQHMLCSNVSLLYSYCCFMLEFITKTCMAVQHRYTLYYRFYMCISPYISTC